MRTLLLTAAIGLLAACDYSGNHLFAGAVDGVRGIDHLGDVQPAVVDGLTDLQGATIYGEIGPTGSAEDGGVTFVFEGNGEHVCLWVDPELAYWNQSVAARNPNEKFSYPDNVQDDGDLDIFAGFATYYTGTPATEEEGGEIGDFRVRYEDSLDQEITISLNECNMTSLQADSGGHSGRGTPEYCTIQNTQPGVRYVVLLETWNTPLDDDRLAYGVLLSQGSCEDLKDVVQGVPDECVILGEARDAEATPEDPERPGYAPRDGSIDFELAYCSDGTALPEFCAEEAAEKDCRVERCFCGDPANNPPGAN